MKNLPMENLQLDPGFLRKLSENRPLLSHLKHSTTKHGLVQHMLEKRHDLRFGYSIDDQARALIVCIWHALLYGVDEVRDCAPIYLEFLKKAQLENGRFHNFMDADGHFLDSDGGDDPFGRSIWSLGTLLSNRDVLGLHDVARPIYQRAIAALVPGKLSLRGLAYAILGTHRPESADVHNGLLKELIYRYHQNRDDDWHWFEQNLRYANGILPYALLTSNEQVAQSIGREALNFLNQTSRIKGVPVPIGNQGWYVRGRHLDLKVSTSEEKLENLETAITQYGGVLAKYITHQEIESICRLGRDLAEEIDNENHVLSHGDLHPSNLFGPIRGQLKIIDWETAHFNVPVADLVRFWIRAWNQGWRDQILRSYLTTLPSSKREIHRELIRFTALAWLMGEFPFWHELRMGTSRHAQAAELAPLAKKALQVHHISFLRLFARSKELSIFQ